MPEETNYEQLDTFKKYAAEVLDELPEEFFHELSGGVIVQEAEKKSPYAKEGDNLYVMGEYVTRGHGDRQILLYFGSFQRLCPGLTGEALKDSIRSTLRHEFRHHMEFLSGIHGRDSLEAEDERQKQSYLRRQKW